MVIKEGYWATHKGEYYKRSCNKDLHRFCGWNTLLKVINTVDERTANLFMTLFLTGGRISEVLMMNKDSFEIGEEFIDVTGMRVLKKYNLIQQNFDFEKDLLPSPWYKYKAIYVSKLRREYRNFPIKRSEPLTPRFEKFLDTLTEKEKLFPFKYGTGYRLITNIQKEKGEKNGPWWPHRLRGERATQLASEYNFNTYKLKSFFEWSQDVTPLSYVKLSTEELKISMRVTPKIIKIAEEKKEDIPPIKPVKKVEESYIEPIQRKTGIIPRIVARCPECGEMSLVEGDCSECGYHE